MSRFRRTNLSKMISCLSGGMPAPRSITRTRTRLSSSTVAEIRMGVWGWGVTKGIGNQVVKDLLQARFIRQDHHVCRHIYFDGTLLLKNPRFKAPRLTARVNPTIHERI